MDFEKQHQRNIARYQKLIQEIYDEAIIEAAKIGHNVPNFDPTRPFYFANYPLVQKKIQKVLDSLYDKINIVIVDGIDAEWTLANNKNSELSRTVFGNNLAKIPKPIERKYFSNNNEAKQQFLKRKTNGMGISDRVWNYTQQYKEELELGLDIGLRNGLSAQEMSRDLRSYLKQPEKLFRRVRDEHGNLRLSKSAKAYNPGQGVYRSSYKNSLRLTATETNMAYRKADYERRQQEHYIVGIEVKLSNNHTLNGVPFTDICDELKGKYPKDFVFTGWHPFCRCYTVDILITEEEMDDYYDALDRGETPKESINQVNHTPQQFNDWVKENKGRIKKSKSPPYFIKDNQKRIDGILAKKTKSIIPEKVKEPFVMDSQTYYWLKKQGFDLGYVGETSFVDYYNNSPMSGFNMREFHADFMNILKKYNITISNLEMRVSSYNTEFGYYGSYGNERFQLRRTFRNEKNSKAVHHDYFKVPEKLEGNGMSKEIFRLLYKQYINADIELIDVLANITIGGYAWARYGFQAKKLEIVNIITQRFSSGRISSQDFTDAMSTLTRFYSKNPDTKLFPMNLLAEKTYGKALLKDTNWNGYLDLRVKYQRGVFEDYLYSEKKKS